MSLGLVDGEGEGAGLSSARRGVGDDDGGRARRRHNFGGYVDEELSCADVAGGQIGAVPGGLRTGHESGACNRYREIPRFRAQCSTECSTAPRVRDWTGRWQTWRDFAPEQPGMCLCRSIRFEG